MGQVSIWREILREILRKIWREIWWEIWWEIWREIWWRSTAGRDSATRSCTVAAERVGEGAAGAW